jgi:hypothetical protein
MIKELNKLKNNQSIKYNLKTNAMRKLFTRLISIFILIMVFVLQGFAQFPALSPGSDFSNHKKANTLVLTTSEKVVAGTGVIRLKDAGGATLAAYQATNSNVTITAKTGGTYEIAVNFSSFLQEELTYTLDADANFVKADDDGQASSAGTWAVVEGDWTAPVLATTGALTPANGASVAIQLNSDLTVKFNEPVQVASGGQIFIYKDNGTPHGDLYDVVDASAISGGMTSTLLINPNKDFKENQKYYVTIPEGAVVDYNTAPFTDNKNKFAGWLTTNTWAFTTRDASAPKITDIMADNIAATSFDVFTKLDEKGKIYVMAVLKGQTPVAADFTAANGMKSVVVAAVGTAYKVSLNQYYDVALPGVASMTEGGDYDVWVITENAETVTPTQSDPVKGLNQKTVDVTKPTALGYYPAHMAAAADVNTKDKIYIVLSEDGKVGTGSVDVYTWSITLNHTLLVSVPAASCTVKNTATLNGDTLFIPIDKTKWASSTTYFVEYNEGIVTDLAGNKLAGKTTTEDWKFTVKDFLAPTYTVVPVNGEPSASQVAPQVKITFNEPIYWDDDNNTATPVVAVTSGNVTAFTTAALVLKKGSAVAPYTAAIAGNVVSLTITTVASKDAYELTINSKKVFDASGNAGTNEADKIAFSIKDFEGPVVTVEPLTPGATDNILVKFNEPVFNANGSVITDADVANMVIFRKGTDPSAALVSATYSVAADAKSFIINPTNDFTTPGDQYYVRLGAGAVKDAAGNANALKEQIIVVKDFIAPTAAFSGIGTSPVNPVTVAPVITFSEAMETLAGVAVAGDASSLVNIKENGENMVFTAAWGGTLAAPTITITATFNPSKSYAISVGKSLQDVADNAFMGVSTTFTTWSNNAPAMLAVTPAANAEEQANNVVVSVKFDQPVVAGAGSVTFAGTAGTVGTVTVSNDMVTIGHSSFVNDETVTVTVPAGFVKGVNNLNSALVTWSFKTHETVKPTVTLYAPGIGSTGNPLDSKLKLTFSEKIAKKIGNIAVKDYANDVTVQSLSEVNCVVKNDNELEITPVAAFDYGKKYYVVISEGLVEDLHGNKYVGITGTDKQWNFTAAATPGAFTVSDSDPKSGADKVIAGKNPIVVYFNRDIKAGSASTTAKIYLNDGTTDVIKDAANTGRFSYSGNMLTINTVSDVVANKTYTLTLDPGIVTDNWNTPSDPKVITFYTFDNNGPKVVNTTPLKDEKNVPVSTTVVVNWDEKPLMIGDGSEITAAKIKSNLLVTVNGGNAYTASVSSDGLTWTLTMDAPFAENTLYPVVVKQTAVKDAGGKTQSADYNWSFTTKDATCNKPTAFVVTENTKGTEIKFTVNFDEKGKVYYKVQPAADAAPNASDIMAAGKIIEFAAAGTSAAQTVAGLTSGAAYRAYFVAVDASVNANQSSIYDAGQFTTVDVVAPIVTAMAPENGATGVAANTTLKLWFNETVVVGVGKVVIREVATDIIVETLPVTAGNASIVTTDGKSVVTITRGAVLSSKKQYYVEVDGGTFKDGSNNPMATITGVTTWAFTTKDTVAPLLVKTVPDYAAATTPLIIKGSTLTMEFNEAMKAPTTGTVYVRYASNNAVFEVINASGLTLSADMKTFSFNMVNVPVEQTEFWVDLGSITLTDLADNAWSNIFVAYGPVWNFIIKDQTPPAIATIAPANNATGVVIGTNVVITFTEGVFKAPDATVFTAATIKDVISLKDPAGVSVAYTATLTNVDVNNGVLVVTLDPTTDLTSETKYTVTISPVVDILKNVSGTITSVFTTKDMTKPKVSVWNPAYDTQFNPKTGVVTVTFSEPIYDEVTLTNEANAVVIEIVAANIPDFFTYSKGTITRGTDGKINGFTPGTAVGFTGAISTDRKVITLTPVAAAVPLSSEEWYRVQLLPGVVEDIADNANAADETIFRVEDYVTPTATAYTPQGATANDAAMTITFDEKVQVGTGNVYVRNYINGEIVETIAISSTTATVDATGKIVTIKHANFPAAMNFFATADAGTFMDISANKNPWAGIAIDKINVWKFSTADAVPPTVLPQVGLYPKPAATNVALNTSIQVLFDKEIKLNPDAVIRWVVIYNEDWTPYEVIQVNSTNIELKPITTPVYQANRVMSIKHTNLQPSKKYYVRVMPGSVVDLAGNLFAGIMDDSWYFNTEDNNAPTVVSLNPADNSTAVDNKTTLTMEFDRSIVANAAGKIKLYKEQPNSQLGVLIETIDPTSSSVTINEKVATITLAKWLDYEEGYYVIVETGAFTNTSSSNLPFAGITTTQGWNFKVEKLICDPIKVVVTTKTQMECTAVVNLAVESTGGYVLTLNGKEIEAGDTTLVSGNYVAVAKNIDGDCSDTKNFTVGSKPVVKTETVETYQDEPVHYVNEEAGVDTMLMAGVHTFTYSYELCVRTLIVTVVEEMRTPTIAEIQGQTENSPLEGLMVKVVGTVTAVAESEGFFVQDANAAWSGIWVEFNEATYEGIQIGNGVSVIGEVAEVSSVTSIVNATFEFVPPVVEIVPMILDNPSDLKAEKYESVLVKVEGARASAPAAGTGIWTIYYQASNNALVNKWLYWVSVVKDHYYDVTGIVNGRLDGYKLEPRIESDVKDLTVTKVDPELSNAFKVYPNPFNDQITIDNNDKLTRVVISNVAGQKVIDIEYPTREIRTANLVSGIYVISLYTENGIAKTERMIKR